MKFKDKNNIYFKQRIYYLKYIMYIFNFKKNKKTNQAYL